ncbi:MAG: peptide deformylase [Thermodesulfovibrionia bacterium]|nr:peptide deformylase [Thermodesulfovibrionia bacterium]
MAVLPIIKYPDKVLLKKTLIVKKFDDELQDLIDNMIETMYAAPGVGLAANQVGVSKQVVVIDASTEDEDIQLITLINPVLVFSEGEIEMEEGCLSLPGYYTVVRRFERVIVKALDRESNEIEVEGTGLLSRALQHEIDHLNGALLIDRIGRIRKDFFKKRFLKERKKEKVGP